MLGSLAALIRGNCGHLGRASLAPSELTRNLACFKDRAAAILLFLNGVCMMVELELEGKLDDSS